MVTTVFSIGMPSSCAPDWMILRLAWWGMNQSTSSSGTPAFSSTFFEMREISRTENRKTACPSIFVK